MKTLVGLFSTTKVTSLKIHAAGCGMLRTAGKSIRRVELDAFVLVDLRERGYGFSFCKCVPQLERDRVAALVLAHGPTGQS